MSSRVVPAPDVATVVDVASAFVTTEYASLTRAGTPVTWPVTPYRGADGATLDVATGLTYPLKAERARRDPRVALSFSLPVGSGLPDAPTVMVQGLATVRDADLRATSSRYLRASRERFPEAFGAIPTAVLRRMDWYWTRQWIQVTPTRVLWWDGGRLDEVPREWRAPAGTTAPRSDPAPPGRAPGSWSGDAPDWRERTRGIVGRLGAPVVTTVDGDGWPLPWRARTVEPTAEGFAVVPPVGVEVVPGPAAVTFHGHAETFDGQENVGLVGTARALADGTVEVAVDRALSDWCLPRQRVRSAVGMWRAGRRLRPRLRREAQRRGVRLPTFDDLDL